MLSKKQEEKIRYFLESLNQVSSPVLGGEEVFDLGMIIIEGNSEVGKGDLLGGFPENKAKVLEYKNNGYESPFIGEMQKLLESKKWVLIDLLADPGHALVNQLKNIANSGMMQILNYQDQSVFNFKLPQESRVVVIIKRNFLEKEVSYPGFLNIFGPVISLPAKIFKI